MSRPAGSCADPRSAASPDMPYTVELRGSGATFEIAAEDNLLAAILERLPDVPNGCREGYCGACATAILAGEADHRDSFLTPEERASNDLMMICVSRARSQKLVLDL